MAITDIPFVPFLSVWAWGSNPDDDVSPTVCLESFPSLSVGCFSSVAVKLIGILIIIGACLNKLPVVVNVLKNKSVAGMSPGAVYAEIIMYSNSAFYGILRKNPFTAWGENGVVALQSIGVCFLLWKYMDPKLSMQDRIIAAAGYSGYLFFVTMILPSEKYYFLQAANWPALLLSRGGAIIEIFRIHHTGTQSVITNGMNLLGSVIRILTTIKEVGWDMALLSGYALSVCLNSTLVGLFFFYRENTTKFLATLEEKKKK